MKAAWQTKPMLHVLRVLAAGHEKKIYQSEDAHSEAVKDSAIDMPNVISGAASQKGSQLAS